MKVTINNGKIYTETQYNYEFIRQAKKIQGVWKKPCWVFPEDNRDQVKNILLNVYGEADILEDEEQQRVTIDIDLNIYKIYQGEYSNYLKIGDIIIAYRPERDAEVRLAPNVIVIQGGFPSSGGSRMNPRLEQEENTILRYKNIPLTLYEKVKNEEGISVVSDIDTVALENEKKRLLDRIATIDTLLAAF